MRGLGKIVLIVGFLAPCACSSGASVGQLRARASFDLSCPSAQLQIANIDDKTRGVAGCGGRNTYVEDCEREGAFGWKAGCTWIMNATRP
jgi:hypothetical protein